MVGVIRVRLSLNEIALRLSVQSISRRRVAFGFQRRLGFVHPEVRQPVGFLVLLPPHMLERHVVQLRDEQAGAGYERLQAGVLDLVFAAHLLDEQLGIGADLHAAWPWSTAHCSAASRPLYSATLLVAMPRPP